MNILVIGAGYVGVTTAVTFAELGHKVTCADTDREKITLLKAGKVHFYEPDLEPMVVKHLKDSNIKFSSCVDYAVKTSTVIFVCVGTPANGNGEADVSNVMEVSQAIAQNMNEYKLVVVKSTVPVGTCTRVQECIQTSSSDSHPFDVVSNPEFLSEGSALNDSLHPHRVIIGSESPAATRLLRELYEPMECPVITTSVRTAELIKYASNAFLATKISYINQLSRLCDKFHVNIKDVSLGMGLDPRIGGQFLNAGIGYGGSCFPKDVQALLATADGCGVNLSIIREARHVNDSQHTYFLDRVRQVVGHLNGKTVAVFGISFKSNTSDVRESPALCIIEHLIKEGAVIRVHDPVVLLPSGINRNEQAGIEQYHTPYETVDGADVLLICTEWPQYREQVDWQAVKKKMRGYYIFDGRNTLDANFLRSLGFMYQGIGYP